MMEKGIDVTGIPGPNPMLGCGMILFVVGVVTTIAISGYLLFKVSLILQILFYSLQRETELQMEHKTQV